MPAALVDEIHLAGHSRDPRLGASLLIDSHDDAVAPCVWALYRRLVARIGARPTLIERDSRVPLFDELLAECAIAAGVLARCASDSASPTGPCLLEYGEHFPAFLETVAVGGPRVADVARIDRFWTEAHIADDAQPLDSQAVVALAASDPRSIALVPHPSARWAWFDRDPASPRFEPEGGARGVLLVRPRDRVASMSLDPASFAFLDACAGGHSLAHCAQAAFDVDPDTDLAALLAKLLDAGAFSGVRDASAEREARR